MHVHPNGSAKIIDCTVMGSFHGLGVGSASHLGWLGSSSLEAERVQISGCAGPGILVAVGGLAKIKGCDIWECERHGIYVNGNSSGTLIASDVHCYDNKMRGICVNKGQATLVRCDLSKNGSGSLYVLGKQSSAKHNQCVLGKHAQTERGGEMVEVRLM